MNHLFEALSWTRIEAASRTAVDIKEAILDAVGDTPLVRLSRPSRDLRPQLVAKVEALNPGARRAEFRTSRWFFLLTWGNP